jgi:hypothetical protein
VNLELRTTIGQGRTTQPSRRSCHRSRRWVWQIDAVTSSVRAVALASWLTATGVVAGCGEAPATTAGYCQVVTANLSTLQSPIIATSDDVGDTIGLYEQIARSAPLSVAQEWEVLAESLRTASTVDPTSPESLQLAADTARRAAPAAERVVTMTKEMCAVGLGDGVPPAAQLPVVVTTTVPGAATTTLAPPAPSSTTAVSSTSGP